jgi:ribonuclease-3
LGHSEAGFVHPGFSRPSPVRPLTSFDVEVLLDRHLPPTPVAPKSLAIYQRALVHRSYVCRGESKRARSNADCPLGVLPIQEGSYDRLEFLGDAVLSLTTAAYLFERYPGEDEGFLSRMRTKLVNGRTLADLCRRHTTLPAHVAAAGDYDADPSVLEDVLEAFLGALFVDRGFEAARSWLVGFFEANVDFAELVANQDSAKAVLNRHCQQHLGFVPEIQQLTDGPEGAVVRLVSPTGAVIATGSGATRGDAEEDAVRKALAYYRSSSPSTISSSSRGRPPTTRP